MRCCDGWILDESIKDQPFLRWPVGTPTGEPRHDIRQFALTLGSCGYLVRYQELRNQVRILGIWHPREERKQDLGGDGVAATHLDLDGPIELAVLSVKDKAARCRFVRSDRIITLRASRLWDIVPGVIAVVKPR